MNREMYALAAMPCVINEMYKQLDSDAQLWWESLPKLIARASFEIADAMKEKEIENHNSDHTRND